MYQATLDGKKVCIKVLRSYVRGGDDSAKMVRCLIVHHRDESLNTLACRLSIRKLLCGKGCNIRTLFLA